MNNKLKWGLVALLIAGCGIFGYYQLMPKENEELTEADAMPKNTKESLNYLKWLEKSKKNMKKDI